MSSKKSGRTLIVDSGERSEQRTAKGSKQVRGSSGTRGQRSLSLPSWPPGGFPRSRVRTKPVERQGKRGHINDSDAVRTHRVGN
jgi:hypothetical protein